jgi:hypothetical protein
MQITQVRWNLRAKGTIWIQNKQYENKVKHNKGTNKSGRHNPLKTASNTFRLLYTESQRNFA